MNSKTISNFVISITRFAITMILWFVLAVCISVVIRWYSTASDSTVLNNYLSKPWYWLSWSYYYTVKTPWVITTWTVSFKTVTATAQACVDVPTTTCQVNNDAVLSKIADLQTSLDSYTLSLKDNDLQCIDLDKIANDIINIANQIRTLKQDVTTSTQSCKSNSSSKEMFSVAETITKTKNKTVYTQVLPWTGVRGL